MCPLQLLMRLLLSRSCSLRKLSLALCGLTLSPGVSYFTSLSLSVSSFVKRGNDCPPLQDVWDDKRNSAAWSTVTSREPAAVADPVCGSQTELRSG